MITSSKFFNKSILFHQQQDLIELQTIKVDNEMGPWSYRLEQLPRIPFSQSLDIKTRKLSLDSEIHKKQNPNITQQVAKADTEMKTIIKSEGEIIKKRKKKATSITEKKEDTAIFKTLSPRLKRVSHLPIISAREQYGHIFKYTKPQSCPQRFAGSLSKSINQKERIKKVQSKFTSKLERKLKKQISSIYEDLLRQENDESLPKIQKYIKKNLTNLNNVYTRSIITKRKQILQNLKKGEKNAQAR